MLLGFVLSDLVFFVLALEIPLYLAQTVGNQVREACGLADGASVVEALGALRALKDSGK